MVYIYMIVAREAERGTALARTVRKKVKTNLKVLPSSAPGAELKSVELFVFTSSVTEIIYIV